MDGTLLVGLHIPKCAGTSILSAHVTAIPAGRLHQSTALFQNYRYGALDFHHMPHVAIQELLGVWGHCVHEQILRKANELDNVVLWTVLRDPVERTKSDLAFQQRQASALGLPFDPGAALLAMQDLMCRYILERFPSFDPGSGALADRAVHALEHFDAVLDVANSGQISAFLKFFLNRNIELPTENVAPPASSTMAFDEDMILEVTSNDRELYERFAGRASSLQPDALLVQNAEKHANRVALLPDSDEHLRTFMLENLFREYDGYGVLGQAIASRRKLAISLLLEADGLADLALKDGR